MLLALALLACTDTGSLSFTGGGNRYEYGLDTGGDGRGEGGGDGAPVIQSFTLEWEEMDEGSQLYLVGVLVVTDEEADVEGGALYADGFKGDASAFSATLGISSEGGEGNAIYDEDSGEVMFGVEDLDTDEEYEVTVQVKDASGHFSEQAAASLAPYDG